ncbi:MAG: carbohydrate-binding family 9-like protein [Planctomycetales bacterium]|nr:carbohydrate-binding family 9-like protein [Planctomycetales bacterium]
MKKSYRVKRVSLPLTIDADWNKAAWSGIGSGLIEIPHWPVQSAHLPKTEFKVQYDAACVYVIFRVQDRYVRAVAQACNGEVWKDSCVEFFFAPYAGPPASYFNLEVNCCGIPLMQHHTGPRENTRFLSPQDCRRIRIAGSVAGPIGDEIAAPLTWVVEYALPVELLGGYSDYEKPGAGVTWHANFYKCADESSHPHWITWSPITREKPDFHRPEFFGVLEFL